MIAKIHASGLPGLPDPVNLDPKGVTTLAGPSGSGKSMTLEAVCFALHGTDSQGKSFDAAGFGRPVEVALTLSTGTVIRRRKTPSGSQTREIVPAGGEGEAFSKEEEFRARLKALGQAEVRYVLAPLAWVPLAQGAGGGRPLRDLLSSILPSVDLRAIVAESIEDLSDADPVDVKAAEAERTAANRAASEATGAHGARLAAMGEITPPEDGPDEAAMESASAVLASAGEWAAFERDAPAFDAAIARLDDFAARLAELGERPDDGAEKLAAAEAALATAREAEASAKGTVEAAATAVRNARRAKEDAERTRTNIATDPALATVLERAERDLADLGEGSVCPTCERDGWREAAAARERLVELVASTKEKIAAKRAAATEAAKLDLEAATEALEAAEAVAEAAEMQLAEAAVALKGAEVNASTAHAAGAAARAWDSARKALGEEPVSPFATALAPIEPATEKPSADAVEAAKAVQAETARAQGVRERYDREHAQARTRLEEAERAMQQATARAARADRLVTAVRAAPTEAVRRQLAALGDLGPVSLELPEGGGCEVRVFGRPWQAASTGELVMADVWLRAGLRRALKAPWLALWVDNRQSWSGELPDVTPRVELRTVESSERRFVVAA